MTLLIVIAVVVVLAIIVVVLYNNLVKLRNLVDNAWAQIEVQLTRRADLIPNLVNTVKGYAEHERETLDAVISARGAAMGASTPAEASAAELADPSVLPRSKTDSMDAAIGGAVSDVV